MSKETNKQRLTDIRSHMNEYQITDHAITRLDQRFNVNIEGKDAANKWFHRFLASPATEIVPGIDTDCTYLRRKKCIVVIDENTKKVKTVYNEQPVRDVHRHEYNKLSEYIAPFKNQINELQRQTYVAEVKRLLEQMKNNLDNISKNINVSKAFNSMESVGDNLTELSEEADINISVINDLQEPSDDTFNTAKNIISGKYQQEHSSYVETPVDQDHNPFDNLVVTMSGKLDSITQNQAAKWLEDHHAIITQKLSANNDLLIIGSHSGKRRQQAEKLGIKIMDVKEFINTMNQIDQKEMNKNNTFNPISDTNLDKNIDPTNGIISKHFPTNLNNK